MMFTNQPKHQNAGKQTKIWKHFHRHQPNEDHPIAMTWVEALASSFLHCRQSQLLSLPVEPVEPSQVLPPATVVLPISTGLCGWYNLPLSSTIKAKKVQAFFHGWGIERLKLEW